MAQPRVKHNKHKDGKELGKPVYQELYKKYQPRTFDDIIGQGPIVGALKKDVVEVTVPAAYLFTGLHGSGKTSAAFVLAKALNCLNRPADSPDPCGICEECVAIDNDEHPGVRYQSMSNYGSIDDVNRLIEDAKMNQPGKQNIMICDEVHRLSKQALDKFLIPLENRNHALNVVFIFCTTEGLSVSPAVKSRTRDFTFKPVPKRELIEYLTRIAREDNLTLDDDIITAAATEGHGSVRDALTALERLAATGIDGEPGGYTDRILQAISTKDIAAVYSILNEAEEENINYQQLLGDIIDALTAVLILSATKSNKNVADQLPFNGQREPVLQFLKDIGGPQHLKPILELFMKGFDQAMRTPEHAKTITQITVFHAITQTSQG